MSFWDDGGCPDAMASEVGWNAPRPSETDCSPDRVRALAAERDEAVALLREVRRCQTRTGAGYHEDARGMASALGRIEAFLVGLDTEAAK